MLYSSCLIVFFCSSQGQDFPLHMPVGNGNLGQEVGAVDRLTSGAPTLPMLPASDLSAQMPSDTACSCEACNERRSVRSSLMEQNLHAPKIRFSCRVLIWNLVDWWKNAGKSQWSRRGSRSSCRTTGRKSDIWCAASTVRREHHSQMTTTSH